MRAGVRWSVIATMSPCETAFAGLQSQNRRFRIIGQDCPIALEQEDPRIRLTDVDHGDQIGKCRLAQIRPRSELLQELSSRHRLVSSLSATFRYDDCIAEPSMI